MEFGQLGLDDDQLPEVPARIGARADGGEKLDGSSRVSRPVTVDAESSPEPDQRSRIEGRTELIEERLQNGDPFAVVPRFFEEGADGFGESDAVACDSLPCQGGGQHVDGVVRQAAFCEEAGGADR
ncbi:MAG: hypothetical protein O7J95_05050 [Planctomycetota bacterium]|nr:hypothetical protein [Planctomycetota bacterium]